MKKAYPLCHHCVVTTWILVISAVIMQFDVSAQLAKIQRKTALLTVQPQVVTEGGSYAVTVQPFVKSLRLQLKVYDAQGNLELQRTVEDNAPVSTQIFTFQGEYKGTMRVVLEAEAAGTWTPVAEKSVVLLPNFLAELRQLISRMEAVEQKSQEKPLLLRSAWAALAYSEDLLERMKTAEPSAGRDLQQRLETLRNYADSLDRGEDFYTRSRGYQLRGYRSPANDEIQLYSLYVPKNYDASHTWPLVVMLHGAWSNHHLALRRVMGLPNERGESDPDAKRRMPNLPDVPYLVVAPNGFETMSYEGVAEEDVWRVLDEVSLLFKVDPDRTYLTGLSMGGNGTIKLGFKRPDLFTAAAFYVRHDYNSQEIFPILTRILGEDKGIVKFNPMH